MTKIPKNLMQQNWALGEKVFAYPVPLVIDERIYDKFIGTFATECFYKIDRRVADRVYFLIKRNAMDPLWDYVYMVWKECTNTNRPADNSHE